MTELEYLLILNSVPEVGFVRIKNLTERFGGIKGIFKAARAELEEVEKIGPKIADSIINCEDRKSVV